MLTAEGLVSNTYFMYMKFNDFLISKINAKINSGLKRNFGLKFSFKLEF